MRIPMLIVLGLAALALAACGTTAPTARSGVQGDSEAEPRSSTPAAVQNEVGDESRESRRKPRHRKLRHRKSTTLLVTRNW